MCISNVCSKNQPTYPVYSQWFFLYYLYDCMLFVIVVPMYHDADYNRSDRCKSIAVVRYSRRCIGEIFLEYVAKHLSHEQNKPKNNKIKNKINIHSWGNYQTSTSLTLMAVLSQMLHRLLIRPKKDLQGPPWLRWLAPYRSA